MLSDARIFASKNDDHPAMLLDGGVGSRSRSVMVGENDRDRLYYRTPRDVGSEPPLQVATTDIFPTRSQADLGDKYRV